MTRALVVTSHAKNSVALRHLLESLNAGRMRVVVVVGEGTTGSEYVVETTGMVSTILAPGNHIDFTGLVAVLETGILEHFDDLFYVHDTTRAGPEFLDKIAQIPACSSASFAFPSMNIGLYSMDLLRTHADAIIREFTCTDAHFLKSKCVVEEDFVFKRDPGHMTIRGPPPRVTGPSDYYGTGTPRIVEYYESLDLYKIKANWEVKHVYEMGL